MRAVLIIKPARRGFRQCGVLPDLSGRAPHSAERQGDGAAGTLARVNRRCDGSGAWCAHPSGNHAVYLAAGPWGGRLNRED